MADGIAELAQIPCAYSLRHLPARRKGAVLNTVCTQVVGRVAGWSAEQAPVVARLIAGASDQQLEEVLYHGREIPGVLEALAALPLAQPVVYRAARGMDGVVRLVAPLDSAAFSTPANRGGNDLPPYADASILAYPGLGGDRRDHMLREGSPAIGAVITSDRAQAIARTTGLMGKLVMIDGVLHAPCGEPGWRIDHNSYHYVGMSLHAGPDSADKSTFYGSHPVSAFIGYTDQPQPIYELLQSIHRLGPITSGHIEAVVPNILGSDPYWRVLRAQLHECIHGVGLETCPGMTGEEGVLRLRMMHALSDWPMRNAGLLEDVVRTIRMVHSIKPAKISYTLDRAMLAVQHMQGPAPMNIEARLETAGITVGLGGGHGGPARPGL